MRLKTATGFLMMLFSIGCDQRSPQQRLVDFINDPGNKIFQTLQAGDVKVSAKWLPYEYRNPSPTGRVKSEVRSQKPETDLPDEDYCYFDVRFEKLAGDKPEKEKVMYLNFDMQNDFVLLCGRDSIPPVICQKIENGISGSYEYMIAFENRNTRKQDFTLLYSDKIFGTGIIAFVYKQKDIQKIPGL